MIKKVLITTAAVLVLAAAFVLKETQNQISGSTTGSMTAQLDGRALPRLVDLGSDTCVPCKQMAPILDALSEEYRGSLIVEFIDIRKNPDAGQKWGIRLIPTQVFIDASGKERFRHEGFMAKEAILAKWEELGVDLNPGPSGAES